MTHKPKKKSKRRGSLKQWTTWIVLGLMLGAMIMYVVTFDESEPEAVIDRLDPAAAESVQQVSPTDVPMPAAE